MAGSPQRPGEPDQRDARDPANAYWRANLRILVLLLSIWAIVSFLLSIVLVEWLNQFHLRGFPLGFWFAQQGSIYIFILLILVYAVWMGRLDRRFRERGEPR